MEIPVRCSYNTQVCHVTLHHNLHVQGRQKRRFYPCSQFDKDETKDRRSLHYAGKEDVWAIPRKYWREQIRTPAKLSSALVEKMLVYSSITDSHIMDMFAGSGQTGVCAIQTGRKFIGFKIIPNYCDFANERISDA